MSSSTWGRTASLAAEVNWSWKLRKMAPAGWRIVHHDSKRDVYTLERMRRFFKGRYRVVAGAELPSGLYFTSGPTGRIPSWVSVSA